MLALHTIGLFCLIPSSDDDTAKEFPSNWTKVNNDRGPSQRELPQRLTGIIFGETGSAPGGMLLTRRFLGLTDHGSASFSRPGEWNIVPSVCVSPDVSHPARGLAGGSTKFKKS
jgi:hypothetical protein